MTAAQILLSYRSVASKHRLASISWLQLLLIASHGPYGCSALSVSRRAPRDARNITNKTFAKWEAKGLVTRTYRKPADNPQGRPVLWVTITPAACDLLKITLLP